MFTTSKERDIYFAGGCFWGVEKYFSLIKGVLKTEVGYANGIGVNPTYEQVCSDTTNFVECVHVVYDPKVLSLSFLLCMFYNIIDPTTINKQGNDIGSQYRTGVYYIKKMDAIVIEESLKELQKKFDKEIVVEVKALDNFYRAEDYHQNYLDQHPHGYCHIPTVKFEEAKDATCCMCREVEERFRKKTKEELKFILNEEQYNVTQHNATESPYQNEYWNAFEDGIYIDITTGEPLFVSTDKFESGCGWPSFSKPISHEIVKEVKDVTFGMQRIEVRSLTGDAHLGHVFDDGPREKGGLRYCINSASLRFIPKDKMEEYGYKDYLYVFQDEEKEA